FGYTALVLSSTATAFIGFGVWVHHMFATPLPQLGQGLFTASSLMIVIPNGVQMFCWIAMLWSGRVWLRMPMIFVLGFIAIIIIVFWSRRSGLIAGSDPWRGQSLEWATTSPPPVYNFLDIPTVQSREPLWTDPPDTPVISGLDVTKRQVLITTTLDAVPDHRF